MSTWRPDSARAGASVVPADLEPAYGTRYPAGVFVFAQLRPAPLRHGMEHEGMQPTPAR